MRRRTLAALALVWIVATPCLARRKTADAVEAANQAKNAFHDQNGPSRLGPASGTVSNRSLKVLLQAILEDGRLVIQRLNGDPLGTLDPMSIYEIVAASKSRFGGRKQLEPADLQPGQRLKLLIDGRTGEVLRAKVLK